MDIDVQIDPFVTVYRSTQGVTTRKARYVNDRVREVFPESLLQAYVEGGRIGMVRFLKLYLGPENITLREAVNYCDNLLLVGTIASRIEAEKKD